LVLAVGALLGACVTPPPPRQVTMPQPLPRYCCPPVLGMYTTYKGDGIANDNSRCLRDYLTAQGPYTRDELLNLSNEQRARTIYKLCMEEKGWLELPAANMEQWRQQNCPGILRLKKETGRFLHPEQFCQGFPVD